MDCSNRGRDTQKGEKNERGKENSLNEVWASNKEREREIERGKFVAKREYEYEYEYPSNYVHCIVK